MKFKVEHNIFDGFGEAIEVYTVEADNSIEALKEIIGDFDDMWHTVEEIDGITLVNFVQNPTIYENGVEEDYYVITPIEPNNLKKGLKMKVFINKRIKEDELEEITRQIKTYDLVELEGEAKANVAPWWYSYILFENSTLDGLKPCEHEDYRYICDINYK